MKVAFLFSGARGEMARRVKDGLDHDDHFFGMFRLSKYGVDASYYELESFFSEKAARFLRRHILSIHFIHLPLLPYLRTQDAVITSAALGTLLVRTLLHVGPKKWIMYDYNISGQLLNVRNWKGRLFRWLMGRVDGFITLGSAEAEVMRQLFPEKKDSIRFIRFGCDTEYFTPGDEDKIVPNTILSVGRDPGRDWSTFFTAIKDFSGIVQVTARKQQIEKTGSVPECVEVCAWSPVELLAAYARACIIVLPLGPKYPNDTMGCSTLVEAMAMGKAIIVTDTSTVRNYITDGVSGVLVPQGDADALRTAIMNLLSQHDLRKKMGIEARKKACELCDAELITGQLAAYLKEVGHELG